MSKNEFRLSEHAYATAQRLAELRKVSIESIVTEAIERMAVLHRPASADNVVGAFSEFADLLDQVVDEAYRKRECDPLRLNRDDAGDP